MMTTESSILSRLYKEEGAIKPSRVVELAEDVNSPLHDKFEWDNSVAGHEYRLIQARKLLRITPIAIDKEEPQPLIHIETEGEREGAYHPKSIVLATPCFHKMAYRAVQKQLAAAQRALDELNPEGFVAVKKAS